MNTATAKEGALTIVNCLTIVLLPFATYHVKRKTVDLGRERAFLGVLWEHLLMLKEEDQYGSRNLAGK